VSEAHQLLATRASTKAGQARLDFPLRDIFLWVCAIIFFNQLSASVKQLPAAPGQLLSDLGAVSFFQIMAWYAIFRLLASSNPTQVAQLRDFLIALPLCLLLLLPTDHIIQVVGLGVAIFCWVSGRGDPKLRTAGIVLAALSVQEFWGHILFALPLLRAETAVVATILQAVRAGTVWRDNLITEPSGFGIIVYSGCSSFHNLSLAMLCWLSVSRLRNQNWRSHDLAIGFVIGVAMIACNVARLCLMAWNPGLYEYWHDGLGAEIFAVGASALVLVLSLYGSRSAARAI
jgi:exosortase/archaeosortase family protein